MKISNFDNAHKPAAPAPAPARAREAGTSAEASAKVELSNAGAALSGADSADFDAAKVERIAQAIRDGNFEINAEAIADKLIANTRELLSPRGH